MLLADCTTLDHLWKYVDDLHRVHFPDHLPMPILGNGQCSQPKFMFVFINPTARNSSSDRQWQGPRFPFIGTKQIWSVFHRAGLVDDALLTAINKQSTWSLAFTEEVLRFLKNKSVYLTNLVKWTGHDAALPKSDMVHLFLPILQREIALVQPQYLVTFGLLPFTALTQQKIHLQQYYTDVMKHKHLKLYPMRFGQHRTQAIPCYFPVGRGNPKRAVELLRLLRTL